MSHELRLLRVYDLFDSTEGYRVLMDRLWPRGIRKEDLRLDRWAKEVAPSPELRKWFGHAEERFDDFASLYRAELDGNPAARKVVQDLLLVLEQQDVLLLYAAKNPNCNHALILREWLLDYMREIGYNKDSK